MAKREKVTWLDVFKIMIPVLTVIIGGFMALNNVQKKCEIRS